MINLFIGGLALAVLTLIIIFRFWPRLALGLSTGLAALLAWAFWFEPRSLTIHRLQVPVAGLAAPIRVVAIGDPQPVAFHWSAPRLARAFERAGQENPDIVLWLGDYAYDGGLYKRLGILDRVFVEPARIIEAMATLNAPMGSYAVLGNHDWWWNGPEVAGLIRQSHIRLLIDETAYAEHPETGAALWIAGLDDISVPRPTDLEGVLARTDGNAPVVVLSHSPDIFPRIPAGPALTLSGHTHCGQVYIPFVGRPIVPIEHKRYACGFHEEGERRIFVTSGIGTAILPARFLTPPEIAVIDLIPIDGA